MELIRIVSPYRATVYVRNELEGIVGLCILVYPLLQVLDAKLDDIVQLDIDE
jgi:hypothetical protein